MEDFSSLESIEDYVHWLLRDFYIEPWSNLPRHAINNYHKLLILFSRRFKISELL